MIKDEEHIGELKSEDVYLANKNLKSDDSPFKFHLYKPHDDRRMNITLQSLDLSIEVNDVVELCCLLHGQSSREVFSRYFQWGLTQKRKQNRKSGRALEIL
jgi:hypothetical protein